MSKAKMPHIYLVEQYTTGLRGKYLTEAMVLAHSRKEALDAACSLASESTGWGIVVVRGRLKVHDYGLAPIPLPAVIPRQHYGTTKSMGCLAVGTDEEPYDY